MGQLKGQGAVKSSLVPDYDSSGVVGLPEFRVSFAIGAYCISRFVHMVVIEDKKNIAMLLLTRRGPLTSE